MLRIGVIGCGTIGCEICRAIDSGTVAAELTGICDIDPPKSRALRDSLRHPAPILEVEELIRSAELVVEATHRSVAPGIIRQALMSSKDVIVMSVGGLLSHIDEFQALAVEKDLRIYVPSGAIAGLDALKGAGIGSISKVVLTTSKPPRGLSGAPFVEKHAIDLKQITEPTLIFSGSALEAVDAFPANINVAAALSLAGMGAEQTRVNILADPQCDRNVHEVEVEGEFGKLWTRTELIASPENPKTSRLAALSAIALLKRITAHVVVGT
jgi:aspartate dehydrogenase